MSQRSAAIAVVALFGVLLSAGRDAAADHSPPNIFFAGVHGGADFLPGGSAGAVLGVQASISKITFDLTDIDHMSPLLAWGVFADAAYITNRDAGRFSVGPQAAFFTYTPILVGIQPGFLTVVDHGRTLYGFSVTPAISLIQLAGFFWLYGSWDHELSGDGRENSFQVGLTAQFPWNALWAK